MNSFTSFYFLSDESPPAATATRTSAFEAFAHRYYDNPVIINASNNMNKRVIGFLERSNDNSSTMKPESNNDRNCQNEHEKERCFRHMVNERMRREKQKHSYSALHSILPIGTKNEKNSIVSTAARAVERMESCRERLRRRRTELETALADQKRSENENENENGSEMWTNVKVKMSNPVSGVDSMVEVLNCVKRWGLKSRNIRTVFSQQEFSAELQIETKVKASEIEEAIQLSLMLYEAELKLPSHFY